MEHNKRPRSRKQNINGSGSGVHRRGQGLVGGPVGSSDGYSGRKTGKKAGGKRAVAGGLSLPLIIAIVIFKIFFSSGSPNQDGDTSSASQGAGGILEEFLGALSTDQTGQISYSQSESEKPQTSYTSVDTSVSPGSRAKYTQAIANGDPVTIMVYMCGTDLESRSGMASSDLAEMAGADFSDSINLLVYTGGCKKWQTKGISSLTNQIYKVENGGLKRLVKDAGNQAMTSPSTLSSFIKWSAENFPSKRNILIFWDHGGGSVTGYGYDEKFSASKSMSLEGIKEALDRGNVKFDFIGFDACLMATAETALMLNPYTDYMIASEETEPGIGWYYTNWLTELGSDSSLSTLSIGKKIADDFVEKCGQKCRGQKTTLSLIDVAEFYSNVPEKLSAFSRSISKSLQEKNYREISDARYNSREFASSSRIDQIDLVDLCSNINNEESKMLARTLKSAVKYNKTSSNMTGAYGVSIYFPYQRTSYVNKICSTYKEIGMDEDYTKCIRQFASMESSGQAATASSSLLNTLFSASPSSNQNSSESINTIIDSLFSGASGFMSDRALSAEDTADYISVNRIDPSKLVWHKDGDKYLMSLPEKDWSLIHSLDMNLFFDDGQGYVDLGIDNVFSFTETGELEADTGKSWLSINGQVVPYYHIDTSEFGNGEYSITGRVPVLLNGIKTNLWLVFDNSNPDGYIAGAATDYEDEDKPEAKNMTELKAGDTLDFICDYYDYKGNYKDSYFLGEKMTVTDSMKISNTYLQEGNVKITYRFTDIYNQEYWSQAIEK